ncbi:MAG: alpha/beta hydrolase [Oscillospiraceae bacterium]|nr:alpha/beta hydrolase [Oscillospiraceae bacterium]
MMKISELAEAVRDFWRPNRYKLEKYLVNDGKEHPFALICPGGGYSMVCSFVEGQPYAKELNRRGYHAFVLFYRVKGKARMPAPQEDVARAVKEMFDHSAEWKADTRCWSLWGSSAGGHLAASFSAEVAEELRPGALILTYPVITMGGATHSGSRDLLLGKDPTPDQIDRMSVEKHVTAQYPPTFIWYGTEDKTVPPENSREMARSLKAAGVPYCLEEYPGIGHAVGLGKGSTCEPWFGHAVSFWEEQR